ncbi:MAG: helix-turn-helix domain-containing protein [Marinomonas foliarum]|uniref:helix-turn-helix domain-containing protein n=1 Tax=Marinomonas foliarum TaxID=491950 RepID=UPI003F9AC8F5
MSIGERIRSERERLGMSQPEFAKFAGTTKQTLFSWETDKTYPNAGQMAALTKAGVDVMYVLTGVNLPLDYQRNIESMMKVTAEMDPDGSTSLTKKFYEGVGKMAPPPEPEPEPELKLSRKDRAFWDMYKELDEKDQREIYHDIQEKKRLAELERYYQENERKKNA